jgi:phosphatidylglycerol lysyltransferase
MTVAERAQNGAEVTPEAAFVQTDRVTRFLSHPAVRIVVPLCIVALTLVVLHRMAANVHWLDVKADISAAPTSALFIAICTVTASFLALSCYDILGVRSAARGLVPAYVAGYAGATGFAISNLLGFSWLTGTAVRYHIYASLGLDFAQITGVIATAWSGFWLGLALILGLLLVAHPVGLTEVLPISKIVEIAVGAAILLAVAGLFLWFARGGRRFRFAGLGFEVPSAGIAAGLAVVCIVDLIAASATLYILMPGDLTQNLSLFFMVFVVAIALGIVSHAPGGLGVFEATMIAGLGAGGRSDVLAAMILYRLVYTVLPFAVGVAGLAALWLYGQRRAFGTRAGWAYKVVRPMVPAAAAGVAMLSGTILLIWGSLPADGSGLGILSDILPLTFIEASHLAGSVAGLLLVVVARGLYRKLYRAWLIAMGLMAIGFIASCIRGINWHEAAGILSAWVVLAAFRSAFYRVEGAGVFRLSTGWIASLIALLAAVFWVGLFAYSHVAYRDALWWQFAIDGDASRFLRGSLLVALLALGIALNSVLNQRSRTRGPLPVPDAVRGLVAQSPDAIAQIDLLGDKEFLISDDRRAFLAYGDSGSALIAKGDPVGDPEAGRALIWQLREKADRLGKRCAFYAVSPQYLTTFLDLGLSILKIGEVARVNLAGFTLDGPARKDFRHARNRMARDGFAFGIVAQADLPAVLADLRRVSDAWMAMKDGEEKAFSVGAFDEVYLANFDHAVMRETATGRIVAFATLLQASGKAEVSLDLMRYDPAGPKMAMDALFGEVMRKLLSFRGAARLQAKVRSGMDPQLSCQSRRPGGPAHTLRGQRADLGRHQRVVAMSVEAPCAGLG